jgi:multimeric flavodoxin WrbA
MKTLILDGSHPNDPLAEQIRAALTAALHARGWTSETIVLRQQKIGNCAGDFFCWTRNPGVCNVDDDNRTIAQAIVNSDLLVYLTPVTFGGYASPLKRMVDHQIQNISPFFASVAGETHHQPRYRHYPDFLAVGWMDAPDPQAEAVFRRLVRRNAINMYAKTSVCAVVTAGSAPQALLAQAESWLEAVARRQSTPAPALPAAALTAGAPVPARRAVLLVGSPRTRKSTSASLGDYLMAQLAARGVEVQTIMLYPGFASPRRTQESLAALDAADLVVLAFPLYVDNLPAPCIAALETIAAHRAAHPSPARFAALANCGFPEASHNDTALAVCAAFARQAGYEWAGSLALGAGEGMVHGVPLAELDGRAIPLRSALELAAESLAAGSPIPPAAQDLLAKPFIPAWLYRLMGGFGWQQQARRYGAQRRLRARPYLAKNPGRLPR